MIKRLASLISKEFIQIVRDPRTLGITFMMPVVMLFLLGYAATNDVRNIALVVLDQDQSPASRRLIEAYQQADYFTLAYVASSETDIKNLIDNGSARAGMIIPPGYGRTLELRPLGPGCLHHRWLRPDRRQHRPGRRRADRADPVYPDHGFPPG